MRIYVRIPYPGRDHMVPYLRALWTDIGKLFTRDLPHWVTLPPSSAFADPTSHAIACRRAIHQHRVRIVRQALEKQWIRESLSVRLRIAYAYLSIITMPFQILVAIVWVMCLANNKALASWILEARLF